MPTGSGSTTRGECLGSPSQGSVNQLLRRWAPVRSHPEAATRATAVTIRWHKTEAKWYSTSSQSRSPVSLTGRPSLWIDLLSIGTTEDQLDLGSLR